MTDALHPSDAPDLSTSSSVLDALLTEYTHAEDMLRSFTDRNIGQLCGMCARWTLLVARTNAEGAQVRPPRGVPAEAITWRLSSWVTNCCNANHALESMAEDTLAGIVASREEGRQWWKRAQRSQASPCAALTGEGCALKRGRPELCNRYFCEAVRDYLWQLGGERDGSRLAEQLDETQRRWTHLYGAYQDAALRARASEFIDPAQVRADAGTDSFLTLLERFDAEIARCIQPVSAQTVSDRLFKVSGDRSVYEPFFEREVTAINGQIRR